MDFGRGNLKVGFFGQRTPPKANITCDGEKSVEYSIVGLAPEQIYFLGECPFNRGDSFCFELPVEDKDFVVKGKVEVEWVRKEAGGKFQPKGFCVEIIRLRDEDKMVYDEFLDDLLVNQTLADMMHPNVITVPASESIRSVIKTMNSTKVGSVLAVDDNDKFVGIFTERDVLIHAGDSDFLDSEIGRYMTKNVTTFEPEIPIIDAYKILSKGAFRHLPVVHEGEVLGILSSRDITQHWVDLLDLRINRLTHEYEIAQSLMVHDLRSPIASVKTLNCMLQGSEEDKEMFFEAGFQDSIANRCDHMLALINDLLEISRIGVGVTKIELSKVEGFGEILAKNVKNFFGKASAKKITINTEIDENFPDVLIDVKRMDQVLENLLSNAIKFSNEGDAVTVTLKQADGGLYFAVSDTGQGIPEDEISKLFKEFSKISVTPTAGEASSGLGLAIVKKIVEAHGGEVGVTSKVGEGTTFFVKLSLGGQAKAS